MEGFLPARYIAKLDHQLAQAGLRSKRKAGEQLAIQVAAGVFGALLVPFIPPGTVISGPLAWLLLPAMGFMAPATRLKSAIKQREEAVFKGLPDIVDMLAITVEAGSGFESALAIVCQNFKSPLTDEFSTALQEMELGLPRKQALQELRDRVDIDVVRTLILALLQADALGIPIGRVLKGQATEVRARRRAWAREKARPSCRSRSCFPAGAVHLPAHPRVGPGAGGAVLRQARRLTGVDRDKEAKTIAADLSGTRNRR